MIHKADMDNINTLFNKIYSNGDFTKNMGLAERLNEVEKALFKPIPQTGETWAVNVPYFSLFPVSVYVTSDRYFVVRHKSKVYLDLLENINFIRKIK